MILSSTIPPVVYGPHDVNLNQYRFGFTPTDSTSQIVKVDMRSARGRAVTEHFTAPSHHGGIRGDAAAAFEAKHVKRTHQQSMRAAGQYR